MAWSTMKRLSLALQKFEQIIINGFVRGHYPPVADLVYVNFEPNTIPLKRSLHEFLNDHISWAVPKKRRSIEKRMNRRYGHPQYHWKLDVPKTNILSCLTCGHNYLIGHLCSYCYETNKVITEKLQNCIQKVLKLDPVEKDVVVLYEDDDNLEVGKYGKDCHKIEIPEPRPKWFNKNLLQPPAIEMETKETAVSKVPFKSIKVENE